MLSRYFAWSGAALLLCSCSVLLTEYQRPELPVVDSYEGAAEYVGEELAASFWEGFNDPLLNAAVEKALSNNYDLAVSAVNVQKALVTLNIARTDYHPTVDSSVGVEASRALSYHDSTHKSSSSNFGVSYEADLFGKITADNLAALENYRATAYDYLAMRLTIINSVAEAYWQYAYAKESEALGYKDLEDSSRRVELVKGQFLSGAVNIVDLDTARINHLTVEQTLNERRDAVKQARTALDALLGITADQDVEIATLADAKLPEFNLDIPARLLARRPDLMEAEAELRSALASYDEARLAFFPDFTLSASLAAGGTNTLGRFLSDPVGALGAAITLPFFNFNELTLEKESALKDEDAAKLEFVSTYINAVKEIYDEISSIELYKLTEENAMMQFSLSERNYSRYYERYRLGLSPLSDLLDAADSLRSSENALILSRRNLLQSYMALMIAAGGDTEFAMEDFVLLKDEDKSSGQQQEETSSADKVSAETVSPETDAESSASESASVE